MNKILTTLIGTSLLAGALYAGQHSSTNNEKGCKSYSKCQISVKNDKGSNHTEKNTDLFFKTYVENDPFGGG